jgi:hypothetical protein
MPRGSKPGERRGGRQRATPNKRTVLTNRILAATTADPALACHELLFVLVRDQGLPAATRSAIAAKAFSERRLQTAQASQKPHDTKLRSAERRTRAKGDAATTLARLDFLLDIARDSTAAGTERRKAALAIAEFLLPKKPGAKKGGKFPVDEFGFSVDPELAREFRDIRWKIACLPLTRKKLAPDAFARKIAKFQGRLDQIRPSFKCPCPSKYGEDQLKLDDERLKIFRERRAANFVFSPEEDWEVWPSSCLTL